MNTPQGGFGLNVKVDPRTSHLLQGIVRRFPREARAGVGRVGLNLKRQLKAAHRRGGSSKYGVPKYAPLSAVRQITGQRPFTQFFKSIVSYRRQKGMEIVVSWHSNLHDIAEQFHGRHREPWQSNVAEGVARHLYSKGVAWDKAWSMLGTNYDNPPRPLFEPYIRNLDPAKVREWMLKRITDMLEKKAARS